MASSYHRDAEELAACAEDAVRGGDRTRGRRLYLRAAECERRALEQVQDSSSRTWGILAVSTASLYMKSGDQTARECVLSLLARDGVRQDFRQELELILTEIDSARQVAASKGNDVSEKTELPVTRAADQVSLSVGVRESREGAQRLPVALVVASVKGPPPNSRDRTMTFDKSLVVGRRAPSDPEQGCSYLVLNDRMLSSLHAVIVRTEEGYELTDLSSSNGTMVDGEPIEETVRLRDGSTIFVGCHVIVFRLVTAAQLAAIDSEVANPFGPIPTVNPELAVVCRKLQAFAESGEDVLLTGERGAGKEAYARAIHRASGRAGPFVSVNCAAIPRELVETELFGYSHSDGEIAKPGSIAEAEGGTLFLDEITEMAPPVETKVLRFVRDRALVPVGGVQPRRIATRIIASTSRTAPSTESGGPSADLAQRLGLDPILIPPLRERIEDLGALAAFFLGERALPFELAAFQSLCLYSWPGNVRELGEVITAAEVLARGGSRIEFQHLPRAILAVPQSRSAARRRKSRPPPTAADLELLIQRFRGNMMRVARELDRKPALVYRWAKRFGLQSDDDALPSRRRVKRAGRPRSSVRK